MLPRLRRQAQGLRWALLLGAVGAVLALALWHYAAIDDLRHALVSFYASQ
ncbi:general secretion pathway protein [Bordetella pertussis]|nr:general secretion pathway protein [Bordetella pertussis]CFM28361.1 general secretion pathway protein [Bordetella pertussis]CFN82818.1 general secretion pathway protein [Bordetella pertussis]CFO03998.1 general secretion pathway protein [Bordetella pertussis]CFO10839.1 general secretion pathway protein [Bordetella pertussis]